VGSIGLWGVIKVKGVNKKVNDMFVIKGVSDV
jgi:hypothetical protein